MIRDFAVGFDFDHTLGIDNKLERTSALDMLAALAAEHGAAYDIAAADGAVDATLATYREGRMSVEGAIAGFFERFVPVGGAVVDRASDFRDLVIGRAPEYVEALPGARELLAQLDALGIPYALLTNGWSPLQEEKARLIGFRGSVFVSERIGALKPVPQAFDVLAKHFERPLEQIWYVGDDPVADVAGAASFGMHAVWFDWETRTYPAELAKPHDVIHALGELASLLQGQKAGTANDAE